VPPFGATHTFSASLVLSEIFGFLKESVRYPIGPKQKHKIENRITNTKQEPKTQNGNTKWKTQSQNPKQKHKIENKHKKQNRSTPVQKNVLLGPAQAGLGWPYLAQAGLALP